MSPVQKLLILLPVAYFVGAIPFGLLVGFARGVDVRKGGSGNIGATNVGRLLGGKFFALVFILDMLKGLLPVLAAGFVLNFAAGDALTYLLWLGVGFVAIAGHMFSVFLKFKGGKGVATSAGVLLGLFPYYTLPGLVAVAIWAGVFFAKRIVSLASILGAGLFPLAYLAISLAMKWDPFRSQWPLTAFAFVIGGLIVFRHRSNIARLRAGTEARIGRRSASPGGNGDGHASNPSDDAKRRA